MSIISDHVDGGFELDLDVQAWQADKTVPWKFQLIRRPPAAAEECGTRIRIWQLYEETQRRIRDTGFERELKENIATTYAYFLAKFVRIVVNGNVIEGEDLEVGSNHASDNFEVDDVSCTVVAGLGTPIEGKYRDGGSGWFVFCNGRTIIGADKSSKTGWNNNGLPIFQPKHRPFLGTVYFVSRGADKLPWDTTKARLNEDSEIWQLAKVVMARVGRGVTAFLDSRYSDEGTEVAHRELREVAKERMDAATAAVASRRAFEAPRRPRRTTTKIQYFAKIPEVKAIARHFGQAGMSGSEVGRRTFQHFLENEMDEDWDG